MGQSPYRASSEHADFIELITDPPNEIPIRGDVAALSLAYRVDAILSRKSAECTPGGTNYPPFHLNPRVTIKTLPTRNPFELCHIERHRAVVPPGVAGNLVNAN